MTGVQQNILNCSCDFPSRSVTALHRVTASHVTRPRVTFVTTRATALKWLNNLVLPIKIHPVVFPWILLLPEHKKDTLKYSSFKSAKSYLNVDFLFDPYLYIFVYGLLSVFRSTKVVRWIEYIFQTIEQMWNILCRLLGVNPLLHLRGGAGQVQAQVLVLRQRRGRGWLGGDPRHGRHGGHRHAAAGALNTHRHKIEG